MRLLPAVTIALGATQVAALSSKDIVTAIDGITQISAKTTDVAKDLNPTNFLQSIPVRLFTTSTVFGHGFTDHCPHRT